MSGRSLFSVWLGMMANDPAARPGLLEGSVAAVSPGDDNGALFLDAERDRDVGGGELFVTGRRSCAVEVVGVLPDQLHLLGGG